MRLAQSSVYWIILSDWRQLPSRVRRALKCDGITYQLWRILTPEKRMTFIQAMSKGLEY
jgi:hypothetical protein